MSSWTDFLKETAPELAEEFENATLEEFEELPEGVYKTRVDSVMKKDSKAGKPMVEWKFQVIEGTYKGRYLWKYNMMEKGKAQYLSKDIIRCGALPGEYKQLESTLRSLCDLKVDVEVKSSISNGKSYRNINIVQLSEGELPF